MNLTEQERTALIEAALAVQQRAYAPYSNFFVGSAILTADGEIFAGANVENASFGLTICAERVAATAAVTAPNQRSQLTRCENGATRAPWRAIAIASPGGVTPCGACRQFLIEFAPQVELILIDSKSGTIRNVSSLAELLPGYFEFPLPENCH